MLGETWGYTQVLSGKNGNTTKKCMKRIILQSMLASKQRVFWGSTEQPSPRLCTRRTVQTPWSTRYSLSHWMMRVWQVLGRQPHPDRTQMTEQQGEPHHRLPPPGSPSPQALLVQSSDCYSTVTSHSWWVSLTPWTVVHQSRLLGYSSGPVSSPYPPSHNPPARQPHCCPNRCSFAKKSKEEY